MRIVTSQASSVDDLNIDLNLVESTQTNNFESDYAFYTDLEEHALPGCIRNTLINSIDLNLNYEIFYEIQNLNSISDLRNWSKNRLNQPFDLDKVTYKYELLAIMRVLDERFPIAAEAVVVAQP